MRPDRDHQEGTTPEGRRNAPGLHPDPVAKRELLLVALLLGVVATLGGLSLVTDSVTFDETEHVTSGTAVLVAGDYRMVHNNPPLARTLLAMPVAAARPVWLDRDDPYWREWNDLGIARRFLFELNDGQSLVVRARWAALAFLVATCLAGWALVRRMLGPGPAALALAVVCLSPTLLAHGRLATTDVPMALAVTVTILTLARLTERLSAGRVLAFALSLSAAVLVKFSWPLLVPALAAMVVAASPGMRARHRPTALVAALAATAVVVVGAVWATYGWRSSVAPPEEASAAAVFETRWTGAIEHQPGRPGANLVRRALAAARVGGLLPDGYLLGVAELLQTVGPRDAYALGRISGTGWWWYFPLAFAVKTPLPTLLLLIAGGAALAGRRTPVHDRVVAWGLAALALTWLPAHMASPLDIGVRHLLPLMPAVAACAGAAAGWRGSAAGRSLIAGAVLWLAVGTLAIHPGYLGYFNELAGGSSRGWRVLAESNADWGQDLLRLAEWSRVRPGVPVRLAYFGTAVPTRYLPVSALPSTPGFGPRAPLRGGAYVVSLNQLLGLHDLRSRPEWWTPEARGAYARALGRLGSTGAEPAGSGTAQDELWELAAHRLLSRLRRLPADERIGWSLFVYHLDDEEVARLLRP